MANGGGAVNPLGPGKRADYGSAMAKADPARDERLAAALRENLRKRKEQSRAAPAGEPRKSD